LKKKKKKQTVTFAARASHTSAHSFPISQKSSGGSPKGNTAANVAQTLKLSWKLQSQKEEKDLKRRKKPKKKKSEGMRVKAK
jgi:hypothetical protein